MQVQNILVMALVFLGLIGVCGGQGVDKAAVDFEVTADYFGKYILTYVILMRTGQTAISSLPVSVF